MVGTGKYRDFKETKEAITETGAQIVTVAIRRTNIGQEKEEENILDFLDPIFLPYFLIQLDVITQKMLSEHAIWQENYLMDTS